MTPPLFPSPFAHAFDLDSPAMQLGVLSYLKTLAGCLERGAAAASRGNAGRATLIDELVTVQLLAHILVRRLTEEPGEKPGEGEGEEDAGGVP